ncbi:hypothetical protein NKH99_31550 [Mesorhizobium sp. M0854]|uniref:acyl-homoserine-lactone synthase n=1 Tax=Mesorhizobium sp. M0854 TaxID=2957013 RepID=UPI00333A962D
MVASACFRRTGRPCFATPFRCWWKTAPEEASIWESSRFSLYLPPSAPKGAGGSAVGTYELFAGMIGFGLSRCPSRIVTVTDLRMERILGRAGWPACADRRTAHNRQHPRGGRISSVWR